MRLLPPRECATATTLCSRPNSRQPRPDTPPLRQRPRPRRPTGAVRREGSSRRRTNRPEPRRTSVVGPRVPGTRSARGTRRTATARAARHGFGRSAPSAPPRSSSHAPVCRPQNGGFRSTSPLHGRATPSSASVRPAGQAHGYVRLPASRDTARTGAQGHRNFAPACTTPPTSCWWTRAVNPVLIRSRFGLTTTR